MDRAAADACLEKNSKFRSAVKGIIRARRRRRGKKVQVGYKINGIRNVHSIDCMFTVDFKVFYYWTDDKVKGRKGRLELNEPGLFNPELVIDNDAGLQLTHWEFQVKDSKTGLVKLSEYYRGKLMIPNMSLDMFPFDFQNLRICIKPHKKTIDEVELHPLPDECAIEHHARHEWNVIGSRTAMYATNPEHSTTAKVYSALHVIVLVERESDWHVRMIMWPIFLINICALSVYAFPLEDLAGRMETSVALLLTNVATRFTTSDYMPKVPYSTLCDEILDWCFFFQFIGLVSNPLLYLGWRLGGGKKARWTSALGLGTVRYVELANVAMFLIMVFCLITLTSWKNAKLKKHRAEAQEWKRQALPASEPVHGSGTKLADNGEKTIAGRLLSSLQLLKTPLARRDSEGLPSATSKDAPVAPIRFHHDPKHRGAEGLVPRVKSAFDILSPSHRRRTAKRYKSSLAAPDGHRDFQAFLEEGDSDVSTPQTPGEERFTKALLDEESTPSIGRRRTSGLPPENGSMSMRRGRAPASRAAAGET